MAVPKSKVSKQRRNKRRLEAGDSRRYHLPQVRCVPSAPPDVQELHELQRP